MAWRSRHKMLTTLESWPSMLISWHCAWSPEQPTQVQVYTGAREASPSGLHRQPLSTWQQPTTPGYPFRNATLADSPNSSRRLRPIGDLEILRIRHSCDHMRSHARSLILLACAFSISPDASCLRRHHCARLRATNTGGATDPLSATVRRDPESGFRRLSTNIPVSCTG